LLAGVTETSLGATFCGISPLLIADCIHVSIARYSTSIGIPAQYDVFITLAPLLSRNESLTVVMARMSQVPPPEAAVGSEIHSPG
jgi:hypothetical protein